MLRRIPGILLRSGKIEKEINAARVGKANKNSRRLTPQLDNEAPVKRVWWLSNEMPNLVNPANIIPETTHPINIWI